MLQHYALVIVTPAPYVATSHLALRDGDCIRKTDLVVAWRPNIPLEWEHVRVVGELMSNRDASDRDGAILFNWQTTCWKFSVNRQ